MYLILILEFFKTGLFAIGGGMATIPFLMEMAHKYEWLSVTALVNMIAISESTPGPIGVNVATYVGYNAGGIFGGLITTLSLVCPSYIIICIISYYLQRYRDSKYVNGAFIGIRPMVTAFIMHATWLIIKVTIFDQEDSSHILILPILLIIGFYFLMNIKSLKKIHPLIWIACGAVIGILLKL